MTQPATRHMLTPARLACLGAAMYFLAHVTLAILDVEAKSDWCMRIQFVLIILGPVWALITLVWVLVIASRQRSPRPALIPVLALSLMMLLWFSLFSAHTHAKHEIAHIRHAFEAMEANHQTMLRPSSGQEQE